MIAMYWGRVCAKLDLLEPVAVLVAQITMGSIAPVCIPLLQLFSLYPFFFWQIVWHLHRAVVMGRVRIQKVNVYAILDMQGRIAALALLITMVLAAVHVSKSLSSLIVVSLYPTII